MIVSERYKWHMSAPYRLGIHYPSTIPTYIKTKFPALRGSLFDNSFAVIGPRVWNTLPGHLHQLADMQNLKNKLTDYLNSIPDNHPLADKVV